MLVPSEAPFLDPRVLDSVAGDSLQNRGDAPVLMSTAPPGVGADVVRSKSLTFFAQEEVSFEYFFHVHRDRPQLDADILRLVSLLDEEINAHRGRYVVDGRSSLERLRRIDRELEARHGAQRTPPFEQIMALEREVPELRWGSTPRELILSGMGREGSPVADSTWTEVLRAISDDDELLVTWGHPLSARPQISDPCGDPRMSERLRAMHERGVLGLHVHTSGAHSPATLEALGASGVDVITVDLDAPSEAFADDDDYSARVKGLERLIDIVDSLDPEVRPFLMPAITVDRSNATAIDECHDRWDGRVDRLVIRGIEGVHGEPVAETMGIFAPPERFPCVRLQEQLWVEASGRVPLCRRDPDASYELGSLTEDTVAAIWQGERLTAARRAHGQGEWERIGHCGACASWFRWD